MDKHFAFFVDEQSNVFLFPDYYENLKESIDSNFQEVSENIEEKIKNVKKYPYKVFKLKKND
jgi:ABC-type Zn2+ transport system substrate-binding protein/surface adhesin